MAYADYDFYVGDFLGTAIALADFARLAARASALIDRMTFGRTAAVMALEGEVGADTATIAKVKKATCAVAEEMQAQEQSGGLVTSERIGNVSVTYANSRSENGRLAEAAKTYLWDSDLLYRGFLSDEVSGGDEA